MPAPAVIRTASAGEPTAVRPPTTPALRTPEAAEPEAALPEPALEAVSPTGAPAEIASPEPDEPHPPQRPEAVPGLEVEEDDDPPAVTPYAAAWPTPRMRMGHPRRPETRRTKPPKEPRPSTGFAFTALVGLSLVAMFFAWVAAEPLWLAIGHGEQGTVTVTTCTGHGLLRRCVGAFTTSEGAYTVERVAALGLATDQRVAGATVPVRMVAAARCGDSPAGCRAYAADLAGLHLRWGVGLLLVLCCGLLIAWATGAARVERRRVAAVFACIGGPVLLALGFLAATW